MPITLLSIIGHYMQIHPYKKNQINQIKEIPLPTNKRKKKKLSCVRALSPSCIQVPLAFAFLPLFVFFYYPHLTQKFKKINSLLTKSLYHFCYYCYHILIVVIFESVIFTYLKVFYEISVNSYQRQQVANYSIHPN